MDLKTSHSLYLNASAPDRPNKRSEQDQSPIRHYL